MEVEDKGIYVTAVCPGEIRTSFTKNRITDSSGGDQYSKRVKKMLDGIEKKQETRMRADYAAGKIYAIACKKRPKKFYIVGAKYKVFYFFSKILPTNLFLKILQKH